MLEINIELFCGELLVVTSILLLVFFNLLFLCPFFPYPCLCIYHLIQSCFYPCHFCAEMNNLILIVFFKFYLLPPPTYYLMKLYLLSFFSSSTSLYSSPSSLSSPLSYTFYFIFPFPILFFLLFLSERSINVSNDGTIIVT